MINRTAARQDVRGTGHVGTLSPLAGWSCAICVQRHSKETGLCCTRGAATFGYSGPVSATARGLVPALVFTGNAVTARVKLFGWALGTTAAANMMVTAATAQPGAVGITTSGSAACTKYPGCVADASAVGVPGPTIVRIDQ